MDRWLPVVTWVGQCPCCDRIFRPRSQDPATVVKAVSNHLRDKGKNGCPAHREVAAATTARHGCPACAAQFDTRVDAWHHLIDASGEPGHDRFRVGDGDGGDVDAPPPPAPDPVRVRERLLYAAAQNGEAEVVRQYLNAGTSPNNGGEDGWTPLMAAAARGLGMFASGHTGHAQVVQMLVAHPECTTINSKNRYGQTALSFAAQENHVDAVLELLAAPGLDVESTSNSGLTAAETARRAGHNQIADLIAAAAKDRQISMLLEALTTGCASGLMDSTSARIRALYRAADLDVPDDASGVSTETEGDIDRFDGLGAGCVVCLNATVQCAFVPCFHAQTCMRCAEEIRASEERCPVCRGDVTGLQRIFLS